MRLGASTCGGLVVMKVVRVGLTSMPGALIVQQSIQACWDGCLAACLLLKGDGTFHLASNPSPVYTPVMNGSLVSSQLTLCIM